MDHPIQNNPHQYAVHCFVKPSAILILIKTSCLLLFPGFQGKRAIRQYSLQTIKKSVDMKSKLEEAILGTGSARSEMMMRRRNTTSQLQSEASRNNPPSPGAFEGLPSKLRWRKDQTQWRQTSADHPDG